MASARSFARHLAPIYRALDFLVIEFRFASDIQLVGITEILHFQVSAFFRIAAVDMCNLEPS